MAVNVGILQTFPVCICSKCLLQQPFLVTLILQQCCHLPSTSVAKTAHLWTWLFVTNQKLLDNIILTGSTYRLHGLISDMQLFTESVNDSRTIRLTLRTPVQRRPPEDVSSIVLSPAWSHTDAMHITMHAVLHPYLLCSWCRGAAEGEGLGNAFLSHIQAVDGIFHVCRGFEDPEVTHVEDRVDPVEDLEIIHK